MQQDERNRPSEPGDSNVRSPEAVDSTHSTHSTAIADGSARFVILGQTSAGKTFRPSDWAERLAGVMAAFRPGKAGSQHHLSYSPYVIPSRHRGIKCVIVDPELRNLEPMAYSFMLAFARDNDLMTERLPL